MRPTSRLAPLVVVLLLAGCLPDIPSRSDGGTESGGDGGLPDVPPGGF